MSKNRLKLIIWSILIGLSIFTTYLVIAGLGDLYAYFNTGADPRSALNLLPTAPDNIRQRLAWLPDKWKGRPLEPFTRSKIAGAYLHAWAQWNISYEVGEPYGLETYFSGPVLSGVRSSIAKTVQSGWQTRQSDLQHNLQLNFYADDGTVVAFTDREVAVVQMLTHTETDQIQIIETVATYDVVMLLEAGKWHVRLWERRAGDPTSSQPSSSPPVEFVTIGDDNRLSLADEPFFVAGVNYYPQATPWNDFWPNYDPELTATDLAIMRSLGLNTVRIFIPYAQFTEDEVGETYIGHLLDFLDKAEQQELKVIATLFDHRTNHSLANWADDDHHLADLVPRLVDNPTLLAWDVKNEPDRDYEANTPELSHAWLRHVIRQLRTHDPNHLITIGWSTPEAAQALADEVDFVSYHYYEAPADYPRRLDALKTAVPDKPLLLQEFVLPTWNTIFPNGHTEAEQAAYYADILTIQRLFNSVGYINWTLYDFDEVPKHEFKSFSQRGAQGNMGLIRRDGTFKPAAYLMHPQADLSQVSPVPAWQRFTKPFWLMVMFVGLSLIGLGMLWLSRRRLRAAWHSYWQKETLLNRFGRKALTGIRHQYEQLITWRKKNRLLELLWQWQLRVRTTLWSAIRAVWQRFAEYLPWNIARRIGPELWRRWRAWHKARLSRKRSQTAVVSDEPSTTADHLPVISAEIRQAIRAELRQAIATELREIISDELRAPSNELEKNGRRKADASGKEANVKEKGKEENET